MILEDIELINFRLHKNTSLKFSDRLNYIIGGNGQGKTTILEAIYYLCTTRNLNQSSDFEAVSFGEPYFLIKGSFRNSVTNDIRVSFSNETNKKAITVDEKQLYRASTFIGRFPVVTLNLSDHSNTFGSPADRRKFVDSVISQSNGTYLNFLLEYSKTLRQRSAMLASIRETGDRKLYKELDSWTELLIKTGTQLVRHRIEFIEEFNDYLKDAYYYIMKEEELPDIDYSFYGETVKENIESVFKNTVESEIDNEIRRGINLVGPHRDEFYFRINNFDLKKFGSQGQHKTFQIALRFGEFFYLKEKNNRTPIFLMDDVFGELDGNRSNKISRFLSEVGQAFVTLTDLANIDRLNFSENDKKILVDKGRITNA